MIYQRRMKLYISGFTPLGTSSFYIIICDGQKEKGGNEEGGFHMTAVWRTDVSLASPSDTLCI